MFKFDLQYLNLFCLPPFYALREYLNFAHNNI